MIVYNQYNMFAAVQWNVWICTVGWGIFENGNVESYSMESSDVNITTDLLI